MCCGEGETLQILLACVWSDLSVWALLGLPPLMACMLSLSILLRLQVALQGNSLEQALGCVHFQGLSCSGSCSPVLHKGTDSVGCVLCPSRVQHAQVTRYLARTMSQVGRVSYAPPQSWLLCFLDAPQGHSPRCAVCLLWGADLRL